MSLDAWVETTGPEKTGGTIFIDFSQIALSTIMATYSPPEINGMKDDPDYNLLKHAILASIKQNIKRFRGQGYDEIVVCVDDSSGDGYWRRDVAACYKANRKKGREESPIDFGVIFAAMNSLLEDIKENFPWKLVKIPRCEADDVIGVLTEMLTKQGRRVLIISSDGDFTQLHDMGDVSQWSPIQKKMVTSKNGDSWYDLVAKAARGDKKDNVGPYRCPVQHYEIPGARAPAVTKALLEALYEDWKTAVKPHELERWSQNMDLLDLRRVPEPYKTQIIEAYQGYTLPRSRVYNYLAKRKMIKLISEAQLFEPLP